ncbi:hypothetical protein AVEN_178983-1, partial [Araneus ventricosus]
EDSKRKVYPEGRIPENAEEGTVEEFIQKFGRPGNGAPNRTESGRIRTQIAGDPAIRFQDTQHVRLSIENQLRYKNEDKENYRKNIDELIQQKLQLQEQEKEWENKQLDEMIQCSCKPSRKKSSSETTISIPGAKGSVIQPGTPKETSTGINLPPPPKREFRTHKPRT